MGWKSHIDGIFQRVRHSTENIISNARHQIDDKLSELLDRWERGDRSIGGLRIPESRQSGVKQALENFQARVSTGDKNVERDYNEWLGNLGSMMDGEKCVVCFQSFQQGEDIKICPNCESGGHSTHLEEWVRVNQSCPFCRASIQQRELEKLI